MYLFVEDIIFTNKVREAVDYLFERQHILELNSNKICLNKICLNKISFLKTGNFLIIGDYQDKKKEKNNIINVESALDRYYEIIKILN